MGIVELISLRYQGLTICNSLCVCVYVCSYMYNIVVLCYVNYVFVAVTKCLGGQSERKMYFSSLFQRSQSLASEFLGL